MRSFSYAVFAAASMLALTPMQTLAESAEDAGAYQMHDTAVYVATNATSGNAIIAYHAAKNGVLTNFATYPTGGSGVGSVANAPAARSAYIGTLY